VDKAVNDNVVWLYRGVAYIAFHDNMFIGLDLSFIIWVASGKIQKESLSVFFNKGMFSSHTGEMST